MREFGTVISGNRGRNYELSGPAKATIYALAEASIPKVQIARQFSYHANTITRTIQRFQDLKIIVSRPRSRRPTKLNRAQRRYIIQLVKRNSRMV
jgi:transposase